MCQAEVQNFFLRGTLQCCCARRRGKACLHLSLTSQVPEDNQFPPPTLQPTEMLSKGLLDPSFLFDSKPKSAEEGILAEGESPASSPTTTSSVESKEDELESLLESAMRMQGTASLWELKKPFEFKVVGLSGVKWTEEDPSTQTFVQATLYVEWIVLLVF